VAQLVAHLHGMQGVRGSSPLRSTKNPCFGRDFLVKPCFQYFIGSPMASKWVLLEWVSSLALVQLAEQVEQEQQVPVAPC
jgi:hypothetical protein